FCLYLRAVCCGSYAVSLADAPPISISAAVAAADVVGIDLQHTFDALTRLPPTPRRLEVVRLGAGASIVVDDEKSTPPTIHAAFDAMADLECRRRFLVLGNIPKSTAEPKLPIYHAIARHAGQVFDRILLIHLEDDVYDVYRSNLAQAGLDAARTRASKTFTTRTKSCGTSSKRVTLSC